MSNIKIYDFVEKELEIFRKECNFTPLEREYFELRARYNSNVQIALKMSVSESEVSKLAKDVKAKILRVL
jgi:predicted CopG family antitoxin